MKQLHFDYDMLIEYSEDVATCHYTIKCIPGTNERQQVQNLSIEMFPETNYLWGKDGLGNTQIYGVNKEPHSKFWFHIEGDVTTGNREYDEIKNEDQDMIYAHGHGLNLPGKSIQAFYDSMKAELEGQEALKKAIFVMHRLHERFVYEKGCTNIQTTAEEAFSQGKGVCQDFAHIFIALMHLANIPARYVTGFLIGEGASHAWVEVKQNDYWFGLDPTNDIVVYEDHIKIGVGRDAADCMINRGIMHGGGNHAQTVKVTVQEIEK